MEFTWQVQLMYQCGIGNACISTKCWYISYQSGYKTFARALTFCHCLGLWGCLQGRAARRHRSDLRHLSDASSYGVDAVSLSRPMQDLLHHQLWNSLIQNHLLLLCLSFYSSSFSGLLDCQPVSLSAGNSHTCIRGSVSMRICDFDKIFLITQHQ